MLSHLKTAMLHTGVRAEDLSRVMGRTTRTVRSKLSGKYPFTITEAAAVRDAFFPGMRLEYLFAKEPEGWV